MKTIILLILSAFTAFAATTYPVMTDNPLRTFTGGATNLALLNGTNRFVGPLQLPSVTAGRVPIIDVGGNLTNPSVTSTTLGYLDATSSVQTQLDGKPTVALTNLALLNGTNVFTGTNTFTAAKFFPANNIGMRLLWSSPTNIYLSSLSTTANPTNTGDFATITYVCKATLPALLGSNSSIIVTGTASKTNANATAADLYLYAGSATNYVATGASLFSTAAGLQTLSSAFPIFLNANSFTQQIHGAAWSGTANSSLIPTNYTDTSAAFDLYIGARTTTSYTNLTIYGLRFYELYAP